MNAGLVDGTFWYGASLPSFQQNGLLVYVNLKGRYIKKYYSSNKAS
jgi:hypothetical protein